MSSVLIVEDEIILQDVYKMVLDSQGHDVIVASNGEEGLSAVQKHTPDVVLLDIFMPVMDGKEFLKNLDRAAYPNTRIIVYTNLSDSKTQEEVMQLGADKFILKSSMTPQDLIALVDKLLPA